MPIASRMGNISRTLGKPSSRLDEIGGLSVVNLTAAEASGLSLANGVYYVIDMTAASGNISVTAPQGTLATNFKIFVVGNLSNGYTLTVNAYGSDKIYFNGVATNSSYTVYTLDSYVEFTWDAKTLGTWVVEIPGSGSGSGASLLDPNYDETFIYYTRSDFAIDKKKFFGSTTGTDNVLGTGKVILGVGQNFISSSILGSVFLADNPVVNTVQVRLLYNLGKVDNTFTFTVTAANATLGDVYTNGSYTYTVLATITGGTTLSCSGNGMMGTSGTLTKVSGTGDTSITYSATVGVAISVSADAGSNYTAATNTYISGLFVVSDFTMTAGTLSSDFRIKVISNTAASELAGFGVNLVQDNTGAYAGDATFETRVVTSTEASTGLITLTSVKFTPGAHQLHCIYSGHDFMAPTFVEVGGGSVQFPINFFVTNDTVYFYVTYGLVNTTNAPMTINNMLSSNDTLGSVAIPSGFTLDKPWMNIPSGATVSGAGNIETTGVITGAGILATTGTVLSTGKAPTQPKFDRIEEATVGKGVEFPNGVRFGNLILQSYETGTFTVTFSGPNTLSSTITYVKIGKLVTLHGTGNQTTAAANTYYTAGAGAIPAHLRPSTNFANISISVRDNNVWLGTLGRMEFHTTGNIVILNATVAGTFTFPGAYCGFDAWIVTYICA